MTVIIIALAMPVAAGDTYFRGCSDGTYVRPHYRSASDGDLYNNWSTRGNVNPYTGETRPVDPYGIGSSSRSQPSLKPSYDRGGRQIPR